MDSPENASEEPKGGEAETGQPLMNTVARGVGTAIGVIAATAGKVIGEPHPAEPQEQKPKSEKPRKTSKKAASSSEEGNKYQASRIAKKKKKRSSHRKKLKRSNTKG